MLKVFIQVKKLSLQIREPVLVEINFRNKNKTITIPNHFAIIKGRSDINKNYEFHITDKNPIFQICIVLCLNHQNKLAGWKQVNLNNLQKQQKVLIEDTLSGSPDKNSLIKFQLTYNASPYNFFAIELISENEIQQMNTIHQLSEIQQQKRIVQDQTKHLQKEYRNLIEQNKRLYKQIQQIEQEEATTQKNRKSQLILHQNQQKLCLSKLQQQKYKMAQILDLVFESGDPTLIDIIQQQIQQNDSIQHPQIPQ